MKAATGVASAALLAIAVYVLLKLSAGPDADWVVGVLTAAPLVLLALVLGVFAMVMGRRP